MVLNSSFARVGWRRAHRLLTSRAVTALTVPHGVDRYLGLINPLWSVNEVRAAVVAVAHHTPATVTLTLRPNGNWNGARAGQYVRFAVEIDGVRRTRCFSLAGSEHRTDGLIEITAKVNPTGTVSAYLKRNARPGQIVALSQAEGEFVLPAALPEHILLISGGSGITPVMSILRTLTDRRYTGRITFLHYATGPEDVVYRDELAALAAANPLLTLAPAYPRLPGTGRLRGRFDREHLLEIAPDYAEALCYACGPASLLDAVGALWWAEEIGDRLRIERFATPAPPTGAGDATGEVRFGRSGVSTPGDGRTLLEQAEAAGLRPEYGCRMGICHTCTSVKSSGSVRNVLNGTITAEPGERIQLCINAPCGDVELDI
ncbi:ferredoxin reductase [Amycolatopsis cihanbeyliensis]|uniref:Ferredoxin-NADP reductase n=1 Tax=Amycolatopsis cihanbeyliensis TaxID=1128664 RepID=A0A542DQB1_AMYCI|nr:ferredoxin-NADP reductase [Amycolatopsis cihanbeyliensis]